MKHPHHVAVTRATQTHAAMWAREAAELRDLLQITQPGPLADYRRTRCIVAQANAAIYHVWVAQYLTAWQ